MFIFKITFTPFNTASAAQEEGGALMGYFHAGNRQFAVFLLYNLLNNSEFLVAEAVIHHVILISCGVLLVVIVGPFNIIQVTDINTQLNTLLEDPHSALSTTGLFMTVSRGCDTLS